MSDPIVEMKKALLSHFQPEKAEGIDTVIQLNLSGEDGGAWYLTIRHQNLTFTEGTASSPKVTMASTVTDSLAILTGKMDGMKAYMLGKLELTGDIQTAMRLVNLFK